MTQNSKISEGTSEVSKGMRNIDDVEQLINDNGTAYLRYARICDENGLANPEKFIKWFALRFGWCESELYVKEWIGRYQSGTEHFYAMMDNLSRNFFEQVFLK